MKIELNDKRDLYKTYKASYQNQISFGSTPLIAIKNLLFKLFY